MGGGYAMALAPGHGYAAASVNYGGCPNDAEQALAGACPIVGSYGGRDRSPLGRRAAIRLEEALTTLGVEHDVKIYPEAGHGFMNDHDRADQTLLLVFLAKVSGTRYHEDAARDARRRIVSFFDASRHPRLTCNTPRPQRFLCDRQLPCGCPRGGLSFCSRSAGVRS